jgi:hypothetical protein
MTRTNGKGGESRTRHSGQRRGWESPSLRAWEPQPGELRGQGKPWRAFSLYRDLGPGRSHRAVAEQLYGARAQYSVRTVHEWSRKFAWVERVQAYDDWLCMHDRVVIEEFQQTKAVEFAERQIALREKLLSNAEQAADQVTAMLQWPLAERRVLRENKDGTEVTCVFLPARWTKATARTLHDLAASALTGAWTSKEVDEEDQDDFDFSNFSNEELATYVELSEKLKVHKRSGA